MSEKHLIERAPLLPWLIDDWQALFARYQDSNLPHALLIEGTRGIGKRQFARFATQTFLCRDASTEGPCGRCAECSLFLAGSHPDIFTVAPAADSEVIKVDQVRRSIEWLQLTAQYNGYKVLTLQPADAMNRNAANSLLKTLEEPSRDTIIFLLTEHPGALPATVKSRCQRISLRLKNRRETEQWLKEQGVVDVDTALSLSRDGPLLALSVMDVEFEQIRQRVFKAWQSVLTGQASVARSVESISELPTRDCLQWFCSWTVDTMILQTDKDARITNPDLRSALLALGGRLSSVSWFTLYDQLLHLHHTDSASFKTQTVLEGIFADIRLKSI